MRNTMKIWLTSALLTTTFAAFAQAPAAGEQTFVCKDGTSVNASTSKGACKGHKGIDKSGGASAAPAAAAKAAPAPVAPAAAAAKTGAVPAPAKTAAPGGGAGKVWANNNTKVYHCQGDRYYGTTKNGAYMAEADAKAKGFHAAKNSKSCTS